MMAGVFGALFGVAVGLLLLQVRARRSDRESVVELTAGIEELQQEVYRRGMETARLRAGLAGTGDAVLLLDVDRRVVEWNQAARDLLGLAERKPGGHRFADVLPWGQLEVALEDLGRAGGERDAPAVEFELVDAERGEGRSLAVRVRSLGGLGYVVSVRDESRLKRLESMRRDFVANVSHELKTPLAAIKGFVETMRDDPQMPAGTRKRFLERISTQSERLNTLVGDLLTLSRLDEVEVGRERFQPCDLRIVTQETVRDLASLAERKGIQLAADLPDGPLFVRAEREGLRQVVGNLVDNAIKYTSEGGTVNVTLRSNGDGCRLEVADSGIGLSPADQGRVFERFYRVDRARSRELGGTGLGLSIVKNTVRGIGGDVGVRSAVGRGSTFWVELPRMSTEAE